jgi:hypothetical protein
MKALASDGPTYPRLLPRIIITILTLVIFSVAPSILAQSVREHVEGVKNFGRVTDRYFRGRVGAPEERPELYVYVYGSRADRGASSARSASDDKDRDGSSSKENK